MLDGRRSLGPRIRVDTWGKQFWKQTSLLLLLEESNFDTSPWLQRLRFPGPAQVIGYILLKPPCRIRGADVLYHLKAALTNLSGSSFGWLYCNGKLDAAAKPCWGDAKKDENFDPSEKWCFRSNLFEPLVWERLLSFEKWGWIKRVECCE